MFAAPRRRSWTRIGKGCGRKSQPPCQSRLSPAKRTGFTEPRGYPINRKEHEHADQDKKDGTKEVWGAFRQRRAHDCASAPRTAEAGWSVAGGDGSAGIRIRAGLDQDGERPTVALGKGSDGVRGVARQRKMDELWALDTPAAAFLRETATGHLRLSALAKTKLCGCDHTWSNAELAR
jgi:hypothetical protein